MTLGTHKFVGNKVILRISGRICETPKELFSSNLAREIIQRYLNDLQERNAHSLQIFEHSVITEEDIDKLIEILIYLQNLSINLIPQIVDGSENFIKHIDALEEFVDGLYNYWRRFERFIMCESEGDSSDDRPYRTFNRTIETLMHLIRAIYRDIKENITGKHPNIYRQVFAGAEFATIAVPNNINLQSEYKDRLKGVPVIRQVLLYPPLILNPPMNKRRGNFIKVDENPWPYIQFREEEWFCYPAMVGAKLILVYIRENFLELGLSMCNLFKVARKEDTQRNPDAIFFYGVDKCDLDNFGLENPLIFFHDKKNNLMVGAVPSDPEYGYFGYLKKTLLTLHNVLILQENNMPFHGALIQLVMRGGKKVNILMMGDSGAGKSETLQAFRRLANKYIQDLVVVADDMGSLQISKEGNIIGYGTEIGAFLRLDDLHPGYAFQQMDRAIIMSPGQVNARIILPVATYNQVMEGVPIHYILYVNNYERVDPHNGYPVLEQYLEPEVAFRVFSQGKVMSKGTTSTKGIVQNYFANSVYVGQIRTQLGIIDMEQDGPELAATTLLEKFCS
ncbi:MAG: hypothetical protein ACTSQ5_04820 [Promethearchaeota archaeon]